MGGAMNVITGLQDDKADTRTHGHVRGAVMKVFSLVVLMAGILCTPHADGAEYGPVSIIPIVPQTATVGTPFKAKVAVYDGHGRATKCCDASGPPCTFEIPEDSFSTNAIASGSNQVIANDSHTFQRRGQFTLILHHSCYVTIQPNGGIKLDQIFVIYGPHEWSTLLIVNPQ